MPATPLADIIILIHFLHLLLTIYSCYHSCTTSRIVYVKGQRYWQHVNVDQNVASNLPEQHVAVTSCSVYSSFKLQKEVPLACGIEHEILETCLKKHMSYNTITAATVGLYIGRTHSAPPPPPPPPPIISIQETCLKKHMSYNTITAATVGLYIGRTHSASPNNQYFFCLSREEECSLLHFTDGVFNTNTSRSRRVCIVGTHWFT